MVTGAPAAWSPWTNSSTATFCAPYADSGLGVVDVRDVATVVARSLEPGHGPRRFLVTGNYVSWEQWTEVLSEAAGRKVPFTRVSAEDMIGLGAKFESRFMREGKKPGGMAIRGEFQHTSMAIPLTHHSM